MSHDNARRSSTSHIPSAPPLPAPRPLQRAKDAATRLFGYVSRPPSPQEDEKALSLGRARFVSLGIAQNATASHRTGLAINTLAANEAGTHALLGGHDIFKTVKIEGGTCVEELNLRSTIRSTPTQASGNTRQIYNINIADVAWAKGDCGNYVAAATSSGKIILYDLKHAGLQAALLHEHARQVHKVTFNPHRGSLLLSGSQDGTVRLWDVRSARHASTIKSKHKYSGQADGVRDVKWSPTEGVDFAFGTDSGWIQRCDMRNLRTAKVKIPAHIATCNAIDWHPDGKHIASASVDKTVRIWDISVSRKQKPRSEIRTPYPVLNARWRPSCEATDSFESGTRQCTQIVTAYDSDHPALHVWDLRRPLLPFREMSPYPSAPTDLLWHSQDLLWTVGKEGVFLQTDIQYAPKSISGRNLQAFAVSPSGEINLITQKRRRQRNPRPSLKLHRPNGLSTTPDEGMLSRSWADDSVDQSFLNMPPTKRNISPHLKSRTQSLSITASLNDVDSAQASANLDDVLSHRKAFRPPQFACRGSLFHRREASVFKFLARHLEIDIRPALEDGNVLQRLQQLMDRNSDCFESAGMYRMSQSVKMARIMVCRHLEERIRAKLNRKSDEDQTETTQCTISDFAKNLLTQAPNGSPTSSPLPLRPLSSLAQQIAQSESASNNRTPQPRPVSDTTANQNALDGKVDNLDLPPLVVSKEQHEETIRSQSHDRDAPLTRSNLVDLQHNQPTDGFDKRDMVRRWSVQPKDAPILDSEESNGVWIAPKLQKHDSNESFAFLAESSDSRDPSFPASLASNGSGSGPLRMVSERPSRVESKIGGNQLGIEKVDFATRPTLATVGSAAIIKEQAGNAMAGVPSPNLVQSNSPKSPPQAPVTLQRSPQNDPGSYPDENGISPLMTMGLPKITYGEGTFAHEQQDEVAVQNEATVRDSGFTKSLPPSQPPHGIKQALSSYLPEDGDVDVEVGKPYKMLDLLQELIHHHTSKANAQIAAQYVLVLAPLLPRTHALSKAEAAATAKVYVDSLAAAGFVQPGIEETITEYLDPLAKSGLQPFQIESVLETYHEQLLRSGLLNEAAALRKMAHPTYPAVYDQALKDNYVKLMCGNCRKPMVSGMAELLCETCGARQVDCPVCDLHDSPFDEASRESGGSVNLLTACMLCNHSAHSACMQAWFIDKENDGGCPVVGCLCDCVNGKWRAQKVKMVDRSRLARGHGRVKSDEWPARESNAVERARAVLSVDARLSGPGS